VKKRKVVQQKKMSAKCIFLVKNKVKLVLIDFEKNWDENIN
jgi:hypothetical protein